MKPKDIRHWTQGGTIYWINQNRGNVPKGTTIYTYKDGSRYVTAETCHVGWWKRLCCWLVADPYYIPVPLTYVPPPPKGDTQ